jgi:DNA-binding NtrC family response regulator
VKLLRLLQEGKYYPIGLDVPKLSDARVIVATNRDIASMQERDEFRKDLYYRLRTHHIHIPPLRERKEDIELLLEHFLEKAAEALGKKKPTPARELPILLNTYHFPGNIRELESMVFDAVSRHESGVLSMESFREKLGYKQQVRQTAQTRESAEQRALPVTEDNLLVFPDQLPTLKKMEQMLIEEALSRADGNVPIAAQLLGISRRALSNRLSRARKDSQ